MKKKIVLPLAAVLAVAGCTAGESSSDGSKGGPGPSRTSVVTPGVVDRGGAKYLRGDLVGDARFPYQSLSHLHEMTDRAERVPGSRFCAKQGHRAEWRNKEWVATAARFPVSSPKDFTASVTGQTPCGVLENAARYVYRSAPSPVEWKTTRSFVVTVWDHNRKPFEYRCKSPRLPGTVTCNRLDDESDVFRVSLPQVITLGAAAGIE